MKWLCLNNHKYRATKNLLFQNLIWFLWW